MNSIQERYRVDLDKIKNLQLSVLKAIRKEGEKHLKYYYSTMGAFKYPESRIKTYDTKYYEEVMPVIIQILDSKAQLIKK